ncbi:hypothetical protein AGMMS50293_19770 [Spirochaetia bacterium]|nr:hypothetical protein AGMMS50293_19770 [Spirochaetia bacterium]
MIIILSFIAGVIRGELALLLTGAVFLAVWVYCLGMTLLLALIHRRRARQVSIRVSPREIVAGEQAELIYSGSDSRPFFQLPGILIRCRVLLRTKDGRRVKHDFKPQGNRGRKAAPHETLEVKKRGAYFSDYDEFAVFDILGFFRFAFHLPQSAGVRLLAGPHAAEEPIPAKARAGESNQKPETSFQRTDNLIDHRPYVPGDDPRRINWKLYGHGGELFVREGEREPPPHSNILILIDTQFDSLLYTPKAARRGIDLLCENALAAALACTDSGLDVRIGCTGQNEHTRDYAERAAASGTPAELAAALAWPAALPLLAKQASVKRLRPVPAELPSAPPDRGVLILALPRAAAESSALDRFLQACADSGAGQRNARTVELIFLYGSDAKTDGTVAYTECAAAAEICASMYSRRPGVRARAIGV